MIVVHTNILAYLFFPSAWSTRAEELKSRINDWVAPDLWKSEFLQIASLYYRKELISWQEAVEAFEMANEFVLSFEIHSAYKEIMTCAKNSSCSLFDCEFVVLAQKLGTKLVTYNNQLLQEFPNIAIKPEDLLAQTK